MNNEDITLFDKLSYLDSLLSFYYNYKEVWSVKELERGPENISAEELKEEIEQRFLVSLGTSLDYDFKNWLEYLDGEQKFENIELALHWVKFIQIVFSEQDLKLYIVWRTDSVTLFSKLFERDEKKDEARLVTASKEGSLSIVKLLVRMGVDPKKDSRVINSAILNDRLKVVIYLHKLGLDLTVDDNQAIKWASSRGYLEVVKYLYKKAGCDPTADNNYAIRAASENGHLEVVKYLHKEAGCNPADNDNTAIQWASSNGHLEVVKYLHKEAGCDPTVWNCHSIQLTSISGHLEIVKYLVEETDCDPTADDNVTLRLASKYDHLEIVKYLCEETDCNPSLPIIMETIIGHKRVDILNYILFEYDGQYKDDIELSKEILIFLLKEKEFVFAMKLMDDPRADFESLSLGREDVYYIVHTEIEEPQPDLVTVEDYKEYILSQMKTEILNAATTGRSDQGLEEFTEEKIRQIISKNNSQINQAVDVMYDYLLEEEELTFLVSIPHGVYREFLYDNTDLEDTLYAEDEE